MRLRSPEPRLQRRGVPNRLVTHLPSALEWRPMKRCFTVAPPLGSLSCACIFDHGKFAKTGSPSLPAPTIQPLGALIENPYASAGIRTTRDAPSAQTADMNTASGEF